jgi:Fe-S oxidoreductase
VRQGYKVICSEPSAALCLKEELRLMIDSDAAREVSASTVELMDYVGGLLAADVRCRVKGGATGQSFAYHAPCHLKSLQAGP